MKIKAAFVGSPHKRSIEFLSVGLRSDSRGFTLIEVLIALTLLSVMVVLLFASLLQHSIPVKRRSSCGI